MRILDNKASYELARCSRVFNLHRPKHFPRAIIDATCVDDVVAGVKLAIQQNCQVAVRSGGHSIFVWSLQNDSLLVDLGNWKEIVVETGPFIAKVTSSVTKGRVEQPAQSLWSHVPSWTLPRRRPWGIFAPWWSRLELSKLGWACERVIAVEVVTAQGELLLCNEKQNEELCWAARGSGPRTCRSAPPLNTADSHSFRVFPAIVTRFHLQLLPYLSAGFLSSTYVYPSALYRQAFGWIQSIVPEADEDTEIVMIAFYLDSEHDICLKLHL
ncbi:unnamed protein product [Penicillium egyptiacum]|uniref:FAD-binding PCMH-type domain-containing protein n=1 Tax=Penicillium egyptiacum TaxID=1303716 RepID=A0A9W4KIP9_9EURO|nr:unnamed protein product [Penicillium egyptiacum]